jgi:hypothetical protein
MSSAFLLFMLTQNEASSLEFTFDALSYNIRYGGNDDNCRCTERMSLRKGFHKAFFVKNIYVPWEAGVGAIGSIT